MDRQWVKSKYTNSFLGPERALETEGPNAGGPSLPPPQPWEAQAPGSSSAQTPRRAGPEVPRRNNLCDAFLLLPWEVRGTGGRPRHMPQDARGAISFPFLKQRALGWHPSGIKGTCCKVNISNMSLWAAPWQRWSQMLRGLLGRGGRGGLHGTACLALAHHQHQRDAYSIFVFRLDSCLL